MKKFFFLFLLLGQGAIAAVQIGSGINSTHSGRLVPSLAAAYVGKSLTLSGFSSGVANSYYYHSSYGLGVYGTSEAGSLLGGPVTFGFGLGAHYAERGLKDLGLDESTSRSDYAIGPAFRLNYVMFNFLYFNVDAIFGLRNVFRHLTFHFQDVISISAGIQL